MRLPRKIEAGFILVSALAVLAIAVPGYGARPPVEQPLIREGDFAVQLAKSLDLAPTDDETQAESGLASAGIAPRNGWIADYPVTPDVVAEIQDSAGRAAKSGRLGMDRDTAVRKVQGVLSDMGLPISFAGARKEHDQAAASSQAAASGEGYESWRSSPGSSSEYESRSSYADRSYTEESDASSYDSPPPEVEDYYDDYGPPVVSYYVPPWDYAYLYSWVPWPFWWGGVWFGGYFVLNDFNVAIFNGHHGHWGHAGYYGNGGNHRVSNHFTDVNGRVARVDPANRLANVSGAGRTGTRLASVGTNDFQRSGRSIMNRDATRGSQNSTAPGALNGAGSNVTSNRAATGSRGTALSRPSTGGWGGGSGTVARNSGRMSSGYSAPRMSSGYIARSAQRSGGSYGARGSAGRSYAGGNYGGFHGGSGGFRGGGGSHGVGGNRH